MEISRIKLPRVPKEGGLWLKFTVSSGTIQLTMILSPVKSQPDGRNVREILLKISWHTHLKHSKAYTFF